MSSYSLRVKDLACGKRLVTRARRVVGTDCRPNQTDLKDMFG